ncbi:hypothetical protein THF5H11_10409 [Vibrio jasicida]|uniref:Uncharacterized protein n=1 Tax=Vibrio jasicida TaxID=766224 RepID=A0AAU9QQ90_9VIBR|nr:hypothetical protein THF5H11_10409 [Vibrio jasicida]CAH1595078.1 hypothetical protein THF1C08_370013 [Vibrio jasicida]CAH1598567.1 hypothetical protein THF1A12_370013 [Vibrio jasicida]
MVYAPDRLFKGVKKLANYVRYITFWQSSFVRNMQIYGTLFIK